MEFNEQYMRRCIELAQLGRMHAAPNPMVGAVIVCGNRIIGEGYHAVCGKAHAEVNAINSVRPSDRELLRESTLYVSLEPCSHYGKTPPCARLIIKTGIPRVVVGCVDPFAKVQGRGIAMLREAGIEVVVGVLEAECRALNRRFITAQTLRRPYITLKWARSADGFIDAWREDDSQGAAQISSPWSLMRVHQLRAMNQAHGPSATQRTPLEGGRQSAAARGVGTRGRRRTSRRMVGICRHSHSDLRTLPHGHTIPAGGRRTADATELHRPRALGRGLRGVFTPPLRERHSRTAHAGGRNAH